MQKVVAVAREQYAASFAGKPENCLIGGIARKCFAQQCHVVTELLQVGNFLLVTLRVTI